MSAPRGSSRSSTARSSRRRRGPTGSSRPTRPSTRSARWRSARSRSSPVACPNTEARPSDTGAHLCLTLLRSVGVMSRPTGDRSPARPLGAGPPTPTPDGQCLGRHQLEYALLPGADELDDAELLRAADDYRYGFLVTPQPVRIDPPITIEGDVVFSCLKGAEDGYGLILRCFNPKCHADGALSSPAPSPSSRIRLDETGIEAARRQRRASRPISSPARSGPSGCDHDRDSAGPREQEGDLPPPDGRGWVG